MISLAPTGEQSDMQGAPGGHNESMGPALVRRGRHGDDRQPSIRLDTVCAAHGKSPCATTLATLGRAVGLRRVHRRGNLDHAVPRQVHRHYRAPNPDGHVGAALRDRLGIPWARWQPDIVLRALWYG